MKTTRKKFKEKKKKAFNSQLTLKISESQKYCWIRNSRGVVSVFYSFLYRWRHQTCYQVSFFVLCHGACGLPMDLRWWGQVICYPYTFFLVFFLLFPRQGVIDTTFYSYCLTEEFRTAHFVMRKILGNVLSYLSVLPPIRLEDSLVKLILAWWETWLTYPCMPLTSLMTISQSVILKKNQSKELDFVLLMWSVVPCAVADNPLKVCTCLHK